GYFLNQIKTKEHKYPYKVYKVPVQPGLLYHQVMSSFSKHILLRHDQHDGVDNNTRKNVKAMETCYSKEVSSEGNRATSANMQFSSVDHTHQLLFWHTHQLLMTHSMVVFVHKHSQ